MPIAHKDHRTYTLNFRQGEEVMSGLQKFAMEQNIHAAHLTGLGAAGHLVIAYYNLETQQYETRGFMENVEILSLTGNIGMKNGAECVVHVHGVFGRRDFSTFGGHICQLTISGAGEIHLTAFDGVIRRDLDAATGLALMCPLE